MHLNLIPDPNHTLPSDTSANYTKNLSQMVAVVALGILGLGIMVTFYYLSRRFPAYVTITSLIPTLVS